MITPMRLPVLTNATPPAQIDAARYDTGPRSISAVKMLRISVTDRCNFRCLYCMPADGVPWLPKEGILTLEEIADVVNAAVEVHGITRFKLTGGEPTIRHGIVELIRQLRMIRGVTDLSLTTNGMLLGDLAGPMKQAGLDRITVSIDSLRADRFRRITRTGELADVLRGLDTAESVGFGGLKVNCVTMRGTNDDELVEFARLTLRRRLTVRFIEYMPLGDAALMQPSPRVVDRAETGPAGGCGAQHRGDDALVPEQQVRESIEHELGPLVPVDPASETGVGPAKVYRLARGNPAGRIGFISAMSAPFCSTCNRLRLTADGILRSCLFEGGEVDVRRILRSEVDRARRTAALAHAMSECVRLKPDVHSHHGNEQMSRLGG
jgi:GTP 3',8-cyclase